MNRGFIKLLQCKNMTLQMLVMKILLYFSLVVQREKIAQEVVESERSYCSQLWTLIDSYINILRQEDIMGSQDLNALFPPYIPHLYEQHCVLLRNMEERMVRWKWNNMIGDIFAKLTDSQEVSNVDIVKLPELDTFFAFTCKTRDIKVMRSLVLSSMFLISGKVC